MGARASNMSRSQLDVYQQAITQIGQELRAEAKNDARQKVQIEQEINISSKGVIYPCQLYTDSQNVCDIQCAIAQRPPIYQCQLLVTDSRLTNNETNAENCDIIFDMTYEQARSNENTICKDTSDTYTNDQKSKICFDSALRMACKEGNDSMYTITDKQCNNVNDCNQGSICQDGLCYAPSGLVGKTNLEECSNKCGLGTIYMKQIINSDNKVLYEYTPDGFSLYTTPNGLPECTGFETSNDGICVIPIDTSQVYGCTEIYNGGVDYLNNITYQECKLACATAYKCPEEIEAQLPIQATMICIGSGGGLCASNNAEVYITSEQLAETNINSEMSASITNDFQSEVVKTITQKNSGLNFQQFNSSDELTTVTQSIKNLITNVINSESSNLSIQETSTKQIVNFTNEGYVEGIATGGCNLSPPDYSSCINLSESEKKKCQDSIMNDYSSRNLNCINTDGISSNSNCGCNFTNNTLADMKNKQIASGIIKSIFDSDVLNNLTSAYTLAVDQTNTGLDLFNIGWMLVVLIVAAMFSSSYLLSGALKWIIIGILLIVIVIGILFAVGVFGNNNDENVPASSNIIDIDVDTNVIVTVSA